MRCSRTWTTLKVRFPRRRMVRIVRIVQASVLWVARVSCAGILALLPLTFGIAQIVRTQHDLRRSFPGVDATRPCPSCPSPEPDMDLAAGPASLIEIPNDSLPIFANSPPLLPILPLHEFSNS